MRVPGAAIFAFCFVLYLFSRLWQFLAVSFKLPALAILKNHMTRNFYLVESNAVLTDSQTIWNGHSSDFWGYISRLHLYLGISAQTSIYFQENAVLVQSSSWRRIYQNIRNIACLSCESFPQLPLPFSEISFYCLDLYCLDTLM